MEIIPWCDGYLFIEMSSSTWKLPPVESDQFSNSFQVTAHLSRLALINQTTLSDHLSFIKLFLSGRFLDIETFLTS